MTPEFTVLSWRRWESPNELRLDGRERCEGAAGLHGAVLHSQTSVAAVLGAARFRPQGVRRAPHAQTAVVSAPATPLDDQRARIRCRRSAHASSVTERE